MAINSLTELNNFSKENVTFTDDRPFSVVISGGTTATNSVNASEGDTLTPLWNQVVEDITSADSSTTANLTLQINVSAALAPQFTWPTLPSGVTTSEPSTDTYQATGITNALDLTNLISGANFEIVDQEAAFDYTVVVSFDQGSGTETFTTTNSVTITATFSELTVPATAWTDDEQAGTTATVVNSAVVTDTETGTAATYTATITIPTARVSGISSTGAGSASTAIVVGDYVRTITGTLAQVNAHLSSVTMTLTTATGTITIAYGLTNNLSGVTSSGSSTAPVVAVIPYTNFAVARAYTENQITTNVFASNPIQLDGTALNTAYGESTFKMRVMVKNGIADGTLYAEGSIAPTLGFIRDSSVTSKAGHQIIDKTDTVTNINSWLASHIEYIPPGGSSATQFMQVKLFRTNGDEITQGAKDITVNGTADGTAVSGAGTTTYVAASSPYNSNTITDNMRFFLKADILVVGSGGYGGTGDDGPVGTGTDNGAGGGAGQLTYVSHSNIFTARERETFDVIVAAKVPYSNYQGAITYSAFEADSTDVRIKSWSGGYGGSSQTSSGENGQIGGHGGGGAGDTTSAGSRGIGLSGTSFPTFFDGGAKEYSFTDTSQSAGENGSGVNGGDGGGYASGYTTSISGSSVAYAQKGLAGQDTNTNLTTYGSGGHGGSGSAQTGRTDGQDGVVIIKLYEY